MTPIQRDDKLYCAWCNENELPTKRKKYCSDACVTSSTSYCYPSTTTESFYWLMKRQGHKCARCDFSYTDAYEAAHKRHIKQLRRSILFTISSLRSTKKNSERVHKSMQGEFKELPAYKTFRANGGVSFHYKWTLEDAKKAIECNKMWYTTQRNKLSEQLKTYFSERKKGFQWKWNTPDAVRSFHRNLKDGREPEIDHVIPVALDGMAIGFDNVQILCYTCHKAKTANDMIEIRAKRNKERQEMFLKD